MPTLTRLAAMVLFGAFSYFLALRYLLLFEDPPRSAVSGIFLALVAAVTGWYFVGPRINRSFFSSFTVVIQGYFATVFLALFLYGFYDAFTQGYAQRYKDLGDVVQGVIGAAIEHLTRMIDRDFLMLLLGIAIAIALVVTIVFRVAEARRLER